MVNLNLLKVPQLIWLKFLEMYCVPSETRIPNFYAAINGKIIVLNGASIATRSVITAVLFDIFACSTD